MKCKVVKLVFLALFLIASSSHAVSTQGTLGKTYKDSVITNDVQIKAARGVIKRLIPKHIDSFKLELIEKQGKLDVFEIESVGSKIVLRGSTGGTIVSALNWYLKYYCNCHLSWCGDQLVLPKILPIVKQKIRKVSLHENRVYFNYCTLSYSASWWDWDRWEREIDFMALNGINMPLSVIGLEGAWYNTLLKFGFNDQQARAYLVGPAFFAWQWMTNIQSHAGPLPKDWIDSHIELGQKIIRRQRQLGMTPIQQGFSGCVPGEFREKYPDASIAQKKRWFGFEGTYQLDPLDPLFHKFGKALIEEEIRLFGTSHVFAADPFHESRPPRPGEEYLSQVAAAIYNLMSDVDPKATWAMQAWTIQKDIACAVPKEKLLILDLDGSKWKKTDNFWGYDFVKGQLHNFGGRINMHGDLAYLADDDFADVAKKLPNSKGMGLFMEGIEQNPVFYDLAFDVIWRDDKVDIHDWIKQYAHRRYGRKSDNAEKAWQILLANPYGPGTNGVENSSIIAARPALDVKKSGPNAGFKIPYDPLQLVKALELLMAGSDTLGQSDAYRYDIVDVTRQVLTNLGQQIHKDAALAFKQNDQKKFNETSKRFLELLKDVDTLLASRQEFSYGKWIADARRWGKTKQQKDYYESNAAMLVTIWGPADNPLIFDYSWREWSGLINEYYLPRWQMFYQYLAEKLQAGQTYCDPQSMTNGREALRANDFYDRLADWEIQWSCQHRQLPPSAIGDEITLAKEMLKKYKPDLCKMRF